VEGQDRLLAPRVAPLGRSHGNLRRRRVPRRIRPDAAPQRSVRDAGGRREQPRAQDAGHPPADARPAGHAVSPPFQEGLVPPRKALAALAEPPDVLELLLRWCAEKEAGKPLGCIGASIRAVVERLGTLDRDHYLESARRVAGPSEDPALPGLAPAEGADPALS